MTTEPSHPVVPSVQPDRRRIGADIGVQIVGRVLNVALGVVATLVLVRALGDDGFGQWATVLAVVEVVGYAGELGLEQLAVRRAAADRRHEGEWIGSVVALRMALAAPVLVVVLTVLFALAETAQMRITALVVGTTMFIGAASCAFAMTSPSRSSRSTPCCGPSPSWP